VNAERAIGVVGLGTIGVQELALWRRAGHRTIGFDTSSHRVATLNAGADGIGGSLLTVRFLDLEACSVLVLCLPNLDDRGQVSLAAFDRFAEEATRLSQSDRLIVVASTVPVGFTRSFARRLGRHGSHVAHVPERFDPGRGQELGEIPRVIGAITRPALDRAMGLYRSAGVTVHPAEPVEVAEASKLLENSFRLLNIAFINEFAALCRRLNIEAADVVDAAATKPFGFMPHYPGAGAGGTCIPTMPLFLVQAATDHGLDAPILKAALQGNDALSQQVVADLEELLPTEGGRRRHILVVGTTYKPNYPDVRGSAALRFALQLHARHDVVIFDSIADSVPVPAGVEVRRDLPVGESFDAVVIAVKHRGLDEAALRRLAPVYMDLIRGKLEVNQVWLPRT
jgi:UDP-N-acetyl-D-glucosamine dehydrogenase